MVMGDSRIGDYEKYREIAGRFDDHADVAVRCGAHCSMEHIQCFTWSHWMPPSGKCLRRIAPAVTMVDDFEWNRTTLTKHNYRTFLLKNRAPFGTRNGPSTQHIKVTSCVKNVRCHDWSWRANQHFKLSNVVSGQNIEKLITKHEACEKSVP